MWTSAVRSRLGLILSLTALALAPDPGQAEGEMTERLFFQPIEKVITAGRTEQSIERAPATVTVISSAEFKLFSTSLKAQCEAYGQILDTILVNMGPSCLINCSAGLRLHFRKAFMPFMIV